MTIFKNKNVRPQDPSEWAKGENTIYRNFDETNFNGTPDLECLMRLVKENISDRGNSGYLRARLLGVLRSMHSRANSKFWMKQKYPKTWKVRLFIENISKTYHRAFNTRKFKGEVYLYNLATEVINEEKGK